MTSLLALWDTSLTLSGIALLALVILLAARVVEARRSDNRADLRKKMTTALLSGSPGAAPASRAAREIAADLTAELAELVRGSDRVRMLQCATELGVVEVLQRRMRSRIAQDRLTAAETLALFGPELRDIAMVGLDDSNRDVRLGTALALAQNHAAPSPAYLAQKLGLGREEHSLLAISLMRDLAENNPDEVKALLTLPGLSDEAKVAATEALGSSRVVESAPLVAWSAQALRKNPALQPRIYRALARLGHPGARDAVVTGLDSPSWQVRAAACEAAGKIGLTDLIDRLGELLDDQSWWVRFRAGEALALLGQAGRSKLHSVATEGTPAARHAATTTLAERKLA